MSIPTPFHAKTAPLNVHQEWSDWSGYFAAVSYEAYHEREYYSIRNSCGLIDVTPLYKYEVHGVDALRLVDRIMTRDISKCKVRQVMYSPWCDDEGFVIDEGTISRLSNDHFRITAAQPSLRWFQDCGYGLNADIIDVSSQIAALALQGPNSRDVINSMLNGATINLLKYYHLDNITVNGHNFVITRTGFTGDLGYELWIDPSQAEYIWDLLLEVGSDYGLQPTGLAALDMARIEAGLLLLEVDYISSLKALIPEQKSTPYDIGQGWAVKFGDADFVGRNALISHKENIQGWKFVGLEINWVTLESAFSKFDLPPQVAGRAQRNPLPIYQHGKQIGQATSITFSPILKKYIALATIKNNSASMGEIVDIEITVKYTRQLGKAKVVKSQFYNPARKREVFGD